MSERSEDEESRYQSVIAQDSSACGLRMTRSGPAVAKGHEEIVPLPRFPIVAHATPFFFFSCRLSRLLFLGPSRSQAPPGNARAVRLCLCKSSCRQAEPARQGVPGQSPGTRVAVQEQQRSWRREQKQALLPLSASPNFHHSSAVPLQLMPPRSS